MCFLKRWFQKKEQKQILKEAKEEALERRIITSRGGLNMPKYQPCPQCHGEAKRDNKTAGGATYKCTKCDCSFFVIRPGKRPKRPVAQHSK